MNTILNTLIQYFTEDNWDFDIQHDDSILQMRYQGRSGVWDCFARAKEDANQFLFFSIAPVHANSERLLALAELITRINYGLPIGNFEMDFSDGEIRYRSSIDVEDSQLDSALIGNLVQANIQVMDEYLPAIMVVNEGMRSPREALTTI